MLPVRRFIPTLVGAAIGVTITFLVFFALSNAGALTERECFDSDQRSFWGSEQFERNIRNMLVDGWRIDYESRTGSRERLICFSRPSLRFP